MNSEFEPNAGCIYLYVPTTWDAALGTLDRGLSKGMGLDRAGGRLSKAKSFDRGLSTVDRGLSNTASGLKYNKN
jgi:hypothetical protein